MHSCLEPGRIGQSAKLLVEIPTLVQIQLSARTKSYLGMAKENRPSRGKDSRFSTSPSTATLDGIPSDNGIFGEALLDLVRVKKSHYPGVAQLVEQSLHTRKVSLDRDQPPGLKIIGIYLLALIRRRKSNWLHVGSIPMIPTIQRQ